MKIKEKKFAVLLIIGLVFPLFINNIMDFCTNKLPSLNNPKLSNGLTFIHIDGSDPNNWTWTAGNYSWCYFDSGYYIIENVTIDASSSPTGSGILIENSKNEYFVIRNCSVSNVVGTSSSYNAGIKLENTNNGTLIENNCSDNDGRAGIFLYRYCYNNTIKNNIANDNSNMGIIVAGGSPDTASGCKNTFIINNTANYNHYGIEVNYHCENTTLIDNKCNFNFHPSLVSGGINIYLTDNIKLINNTANNNGHHGIRTSSSDFCNITGNTISNNFKYGLHMIYSDFGNITINTINDNSHFGLYLQLCDNNLVKNNTINRNDLAIALDTCYFNNITGNDLRDNDWCIYEILCVGNIFEYNECSPTTINPPIYIDGTSTVVGAHNWTWAESQPWCSGSGTSEDPYIIENLKISGFGVFNGIEIWNSNVSFIIRECLIYNTDTAIYFDEVDYSRLIRNNCSNNNFGIYLQYSDNHSIIENIANGNDYEGIYLCDCDNNNITGNIVNDNDQAGIYLEYSDYNNITDNTANSNHDGIYLEQENYNNTIAGNIFNNNEIGIDLYYSDFNIIVDNIANNNNYDGIEVEGSSYNNITGNLVKNNTVYGLLIETDSNNNLIFKNFFVNNGLHAIDDGIDNKWNSSMIGNYWDNHTGPDIAPQDGIVDFPYNISGSTMSKDYLPIADESSPVVIINSPNDGDPFANSAPNYDVTITDDYLYEMWYTLDEGLHNYTFFDFSGSIEQSVWDALVDGDVTLTFYASDMPGHIGSATVVIAKDTIGPIIIINSPSAGAEFGVNAPTFIIIVEDEHLDSIWYSLDGGLTTYMITTNATIDQTAWAALSEGSITITFYANDTLGNLTFEDVTITKEIPPGGLDSTIITVIIVVSVVGAVVIITGVYIFIRKRATTT